MCFKQIGDDQDSTVLICHAAGQTFSHTSHVHDKCWERFKKQFVRGRAGGRSATVFFCPVEGCHNALEHTHTHARKVEKKPERRGLTEKDDTASEEYSASKQESSSSRRRREEEGVEEVPPPPPMPSPAAARFLPCPRSHRVAAMAAHT